MGISSSYDKDDAKIDSSKLTLEKESKTTRKSSKTEMLLDQISLGSNASLNRKFIQGEINDLNNEELVSATIFDVEQQSNNNSQIGSQKSTKSVHSKSESHFSIKSSNHESEKKNERSFSSIEVSQTSAYNESNDEDNQSLATISSKSQNNTTEKLEHAFITSLETEYHTQEKTNSEQLTDKNNETVLAAG